MASFRFSRGNPSVNSLLNRARRLRGRQHVAEALASYREACDLMRAASQDLPTDPDLAEQLAGALVEMGACQLVLGDAEDAATTLTEAESVCEKLARLQSAMRSPEITITILEDVVEWPGMCGEPRTANLLAVAVAYRALAHNAIGNPFSGISDAQQAVLTHVLLAEDDPNSSSWLEVAQSAAAAAHVQVFLNGDPELAVAAADYAVSTLLDAVRDGAPVGEPHMLAAIESSVIVETALARPRAMVGVLLHPSGSALGPRDIADLAGHLAARRSLPDVLAERAPDLAGELPDLAVADTTLVPLMRVNWHRAPEFAERLSVLCRTCFDDNDVTGALRLGLEAHALFAGASMLGTTPMRYQYHRYGPAWARVLHAIGRYWQDRGEQVGVLDAAGWLGGVLNNVLVHALIDEDIRTATRPQAQWLRETYRAAGKDLLMQRAEERLAMLDRFG